MSVLKSMRGQSAMQFVETARRLELHAFSVVTKAPKRYGPYLLQPIMSLASAVHDNVRAANNTIPRNRHEAQIRRDYLSAANVALQNLSPKLTMLYDAILQNPEKCPWIDNAMEQVRLKKFTDLFIQMCEKYLSPDEEDTDCADSKGDRE